MEKVSIDFAGRMFFFTLLGIVFSEKLLITLET